ncbi:MAG: hypothetical protein US76_01800 [Parcubacteria group bacterium GW2011_GWA2_38_13b]|nr:MAG: hypothetical protein US76_01800 [Parcubacteria group bacterium GW2011_GWA2_38_13b]
MPFFNFKIVKKDSNSLARAGIFITPHGAIETPAFLPVATNAALKGLNINKHKSLPIRVFIANTYHLWQRPGDGVIKKIGGLHKFMNWDGPIFTDSGGFQAFSLGCGREQGVGKIGSVFTDENVNCVEKNNVKRENLVKINEKGIKFRSFIDGSWQELTPEKSIKIQENLGADVIFAFDECTSPTHDYKYTKDSLDRTHGWAERCLKAKARNDQALFGIVQGGVWKDLRMKSARFISRLPFDGFGIGGSLGKSKKDMYNILDWVVPLLPENKQRHLLGIGGVEDIFEGISRGVDTFDCASPTKEARHGTLWTKGGKINIRKAIYKNDKKPIEKKCGCFTCLNGFSRAYLRHLLNAGEILGYELAILHNLYFVLNLMKEIRESIINNNFDKLKSSFLKNFKICFAATRSQQCRRVGSWRDD